MDYEELCKMMKLFFALVIFSTFSLRIMRMWGLNEMTSQKVSLYYL